MPESTTTGNEVYQRNVHKTVCLFINWGTMLNNQKINYIFVEFMKKQCIWENVEGIAKIKTDESVWPCEQIKEYSQTI
jgi:hypothetical protein